MKKAILATKVGMTQIFNADGVLVPVTVLQAGPCYVTQIKTVDNDGYSAVQVGFVDKKEKVVNKDANGKKEIRNRHGVNKAEKGHFDKAGVSGKRFVREFKFDNAEEYNLADVIKADIFAEGDKIDATAISKGKGFQGAIKRFGQHRGPMAHGSKFHRHQGSNGACSSPSKVFKGKGMPGHMGSVKVTVQNLEVVRVDAENNLLLVKGSVPGPKKSLVTIKETVQALPERMMEFCVLGGRIYEAGTDIVFSECGRARQYHGGCKITLHFSACTEQTDHVVGTGDRSAAV